MLKIAAVLMLAQAAGSAPTPQPAAMPEWLTGAWSMRTDEGAWAEEWWTTERAGMMIGAGRSGKADQLGFWEHMRIVRSGDGVSFCALPQGEKGACFKAVSVGAAEIVFENAAHDYPQRIRYWREGDELNAETALKDGSRASRWRYKRLN